MSDTDTIIGRIMVLENKAMAIERETREAHNEIKSALHEIIEAQKRSDKAILESQRKSDRLYTCLSTGQWLMKSMIMTIGGIGASYLAIKAGADFVVKHFP